LILRYRTPENPVLIACGNPAQYVNPDGMAPGSVYSHFSPASTFRPVPEPRLAFILGIGFPLK